MTFPLAKDTNSATSDHANQFGAVQERAKRTRGARQNHHDLIEASNCNVVQGTSCSTQACHTVIRVSTGAESIAMTADQNSSSPLEVDAAMEFAVNVTSFLVLLSSHVWSGASQSQLPREAPLCSC